MTAPALLVGLVAMAMVVIAVPLISFLCVGWHIKRKDILDGLSAESRFKYFEMFCRYRAVDAGKAHDDMDAMYLRWYGRRHFALPLVVLGLVCATALYLAFSGAFAAQGAGIVLVNVKPIGMSSIAGAYLWVVNDVISRVRKLDLSPSDLNWNSLRLAISVPLGFSIAGLASNGLGPFVAFAAGAFPLNTLMDILRRAAVKQFGYEQVNAPGDEIVKLQGVNDAIATRLINEDIATITQVAYCDPVRLTMRSNLTFNVVTDLMNQALAWEYLGEGMNAIRPLGLRGAVEIKHLKDALDAAPAHQANAAAVAALPAIAAALNQSPATLAIVLDEIARDPFTLYLDSIWE